jgi:hypothetical protein
MPLLPKPNNNVCPNVMSTVAPDIVNVVKGPFVPSTGVIPHLAIPSYSSWVNVKLPSIPGMVTTSPSLHHLSPILACSKSILIFSTPLFSFNIIFCILFVPLLLIVYVPAVSSYRASSGVNFFISKESVPNIICITAPSCIPYSKLASVVCANINGVSIPFCFNLYSVTVFSGFNHPPPVY